MSEQDRVDTPEHDDVEGHGPYNPSATEEPKDDVEAHGPFNPAATQEPDSSDSDDFEAHKHHPS